MFSYPNSPIPLIPRSFSEDIQKYMESMPGRISAATAFDLPKPLMKQQKPIPQ